MRNTSVFTENVIKHDHAKVLLINQHGHKLNPALTSTNWFAPNCFFFLQQTAVEFNLSLRLPKCYHCRYMQRISYPSGYGKNNFSSVTQSNQIIIHILATSKYCEYCVQHKYVKNQWRSDKFLYIGNRIVNDWKLKLKCLT